MQPKLKLYTLKFLFSYGNLLTPLGPVIVLTACAIAGYLCFLPNGSIKPLRLPHASPIADAKAPGDSRKC